MKKTFIIVGLLILVGIGAFVMRPKKSAEVQVSPTSGYKLVVLAGDVSVIRSGETARQTVGDSTEVATGDQVITSLSGRARLRWPNGTLTTIDEDSQVRIAELSDGGAKSRLVLIFGDMWSKVTRILGPGEFYEVDTRETVAAVRGTIFRTTYRKNRARVEVMEHKVRVTTRNADGSTQEDTGVELDERTYGVVGTSGPSLRKVVVGRLNDTELQDAFHKRFERERNADDSQVRSTSSPTPTPSPSVSPRLLPTVSVTVKPTSTPTPTPTPSPSPSATPTPTPNLNVSVSSVFPKALAAGQTFTIVGDNFLSGRNISRISQITVGGKPVIDMAIIDSSDVFVTPPQLAPGTYDISILATDGTQVTLSGAVTIQ